MRDRTDTRQEHFPNRVGYNLLLRPLTYRSLSHFNTTPILDPDIQVPTFKSENS